MTGEDLYIMIIYDDSNGSEILRKHEFFLYHKAVYPKFAEHGKGLLQLFIIESKAQFDYFMYF